MNCALRCLITESMNPKPKHSVTVLLQDGIMVKKKKINLPLKDSWVSLDPMKKIKLLYSTDQVVVMHMKNTF